MRSETLSEACAPVLMYLATFRRNAATTGISLQALQNALRAELDKVRVHCERDPRLAPLLQRSFYALVATADQVVLGSAWPERVSWSMSLLETSYFGSASGGSTFFAFVEEIKHEPTEEAAEIAGLLFLCMAMGFQGQLRGERRELELRRQELFDKARLGASDVGHDGAERHMTPDAYGRNSSIQGVKLPTVSTLRVAAVAVVAIFASLAFGKIVTRMQIRSDVKTFDGMTDQLRSESSSDAAEGDE
ncbi:MAG: DotU family type IV/VI secretion system protein [Planctomycetota bacterium]